MINKLKRYKFYFVFIFAAAVISFNGAFDSNDPDYLEALKISSGTDVKIIIPEVSRVMPVILPILGETENSIVNPPGYMSVVDTFTIQANPGPPNNGLSANAGMFFNLIAGPRNVIVTQMSTGSNATANSAYSVEIFTRVGNALGGPVGSGPGSSSAGWTSIGTVPVTQGTTANGISLVFNIPPITMNAGDTVGVAVRFNTAGPRYFGTGTPPLSTYADTNLTLITGDGRSAPFTTTGTWFQSRALTGVIRYVMGTPTGTGNNGTEIPDGFNLAQNYPNPFNPSTTIEFGIPERSNVTLRVYNAYGQEVATLVRGDYAAGSYKFNWDATGYASGVYFYVLKADNFTQTKKMLLVK